MSTNTFEYGTYIMTVWQVTSTTVDTEIFRDPEAAENYRRWIMFQGSGSDLNASVTAIEIACKVVNGVVVVPENVL